MITIGMALWCALSIPTALAVGRVFRRPTEPYDTRPERGPTMAIGPYPLDRRELNKIVAMFDPAGLVLDEPDADGYTEVVFSYADAAIDFVLIARDGDRLAPPFVGDVRTLLRVDNGPVTLGVTLLPEWRPAVVASVTVLAEALAPPAEEAA